jgi:tRNA(Ile)-lysidine synthase
MNALRGSGVHGLAGIPVRRDEGRIIRPLLFAYRSEIERYARETGIRFRTDSSNSSLAYTRNVVRMNLMPLLQQHCEANIAQSLNRLSAVMREAEGQLSTQTDAVYHQIVTTRQTRTMVNIPRLRSQSPLVQDEILLRVFRQLGVEPQRGKLLHVLQLCEAQTGKTMSLTKTIRVLRDRDHLCFDDASQAEPFAYPVVLGQEYEFPSFRFAARLRKTVPQQFSRRATTEFVDAERLGKNLVLRNWREGDWFMPLGLHGKKKLSDFFVDEKVPRTDKHCIPVLESDGSIVWVCGYRLDERFMVTSQTSTAVELHYCPHTS